MCLEMGRELGLCKRLQVGIWAEASNALLFNKHKAAQNQAELDTKFCNAMWHFVIILNNMNCFIYGEWNFKK